MDRHGQGVDAGIGPACGMKRHRLTGNGVDGLFHRLLHRRPMGLALQAHEGCAIEFEGEGEAGQARLAPAAIVQPRNKSAVAMAGRPAR